MVIQAANKFPAFVESEVLWHSSQTPVTEFYSESVESLPRLQILFIGYLF
jgi:hypothetical protein